MTRKGGVGGGPHARGQEEDMERTVRFLVQSGTKRYKALYKAVRILVQSATKHHFDYKININ